MSWRQLPREDLLDTVVIPNEQIGGLSDLEPIIPEPKRPRRVCRDHVEHCLELIRIGQVRGVCHEEGHLQLAGSAERVVRVVHVVLARGDVHAGAHKLTYPGDAAADRLLIAAARKDKADMRVADDRHACLPDEADHLFGIDVIVGG